MWDNTKELLNKWRVVEMKDLKIHMVGTGGIGMSALAKFAQDRGAKVSGCDMVDSEMLEELRRRGIRCWVGHSPQHIEDAELVVRSTAVPATEPEILEAYRRHTVVLTRGKFLARILHEYTVIAVTGSHGKSTTTCFVAQVLLRAGLDPCVLVGGIVEDLGGNYRYGKGGFFVIELDESSGSHLELQPNFAVVTNIDWDHTDYYRSLSDVEKSFQIFVESVDGSGCLFGCWDDERVRPLLQITKRASSYGLSQGADLRAIDVEFLPDITHFSVSYKGKLLGRTFIRPPGLHNVRNALAGIAVGQELGIEWSAISEGLKECRGVKRRQEFVGSALGVSVYDDYAHHPTEVRELLKAMRTRVEGRIVAVFQPHRYTRTRDLHEQFGDAFDGVNYLVVTPIYPACEAEIEGISHELIVEAVRQSGKVPVEASLSPVESTLSILQHGDTLLTIGAGDVWKVGKEILEHLRRKECHRE